MILVAIACLGVAYYVVNVSSSRHPSTQATSPAPTERSAQDPTPSKAQLSGVEPTKRRVIAESPPAEPTKQKVTYATEAEEWADKYKTLSIAQMVAHRDSLQNQLFDLVQPEAEKLTAEGRVEYLDQSNKYSPPKEDTILIRSVYLPGAGSSERIRRVTLDESEYPELYKMKREIAWISHEVVARQNM